MTKIVAVRNLRLCTKDCLCLYVCPVGATDTEDSIIDVNKCTGCGMCAKACPSQAISLVPLTYPPQQKKSDEVKGAFYSTVQNKADIEQISRQLRQNNIPDGFYRLLKAIERSQRLVSEDLMREAGYMLPQSKNTHDLLESLLDTPGVSKETIEKLLNNIETNDKTKKWVCTICGYVHEGEAPPDICPICKQPKDKFKEI